jgi:hypothetical protein
VHENKPRRHSQVDKKHKQLTYVKLCCNLIYLLFLPLIFYVQRARRVAAPLQSSNMERTNKPMTIALSGIVKGISPGNQDVARWVWA